MSSNAYIEKPKTGSVPECGIKCVALLFPRVYKYYLRLTLPLPTLVALGLGLFWHDQQESLR
jgi:hypothetical protein